VNLNLALLRAFIPPGLHQQTKKKVFNTLGPTRKTKQKELFLLFFFFCINIGGGFDMLFPQAQPRLTLSTIL